MEMEIIDKLYLELSQISKAKTARDILFEGQLSDARFWNAIKILSIHDRLTAMYLVRLVTGEGLAYAKEYVDNIDEYRDKVTNPLQLMSKNL